MSKIIVSTMGTSLFTNICRQFEEKGENYFNFAAKVYDLNFLERWLRSMGASVIVL